MKSGRCVALCLALTLALAFSAASVADARELQSSGSCGLTALPTDVLANLSVGHAKVLQLKLQIFIDRTNELLALLPKGDLLNEIVRLVEQILCAVVDILKSLRIKVDLKLGDLLKLDAKVINGRRLSAIPDLTGLLTGAEKLPEGVTGAKLLKALTNWRNAAKDLLVLFPLSDLLHEVVGLVESILHAVGKLLRDLGISLNGLPLKLGNLGLLRLVQINADIDLSHDLAIKIKAALLDVKVKADVLIKLLPKGGLLDAVRRLLNAVLRLVAKLLINLGIDLDLNHLLSGLGADNGKIVSLRVLANLSLPSLPAGTKLPKGVTPGQVNKALKELRGALKTLANLLPRGDLLDAILIAVSKILKAVVKLLNRLLKDLGVHHLLKGLLKGLPFNKVTNVGLLQGVLKSLGLGGLMNGLLGGLLSGLG